MKHLKKFNESLQSVEIDELKDFCETSLAYLLDDGYNVSLSVRDQVKYPDKKHIIVSLGFLGVDEYGFLNPYEHEPFHWDDVKDYYIPFLQMLVRRYELLPYEDKTGQLQVCWIGGSQSSYVSFNSNKGFKYLSLDQVINDEVWLDGQKPHSLTTEFDSRLWGINIKIVDKI